MRGKIFFVREPSSYQIVTNSIWTFTQTIGFDTHSNVEEKLSDLFIQVNSALGAFNREMEAVGLWKNVTLVQTSDFARTLNPNSGQGTDHAWGGNYIMMGEYTYKKVRHDILLNSNVLTIPHLDILKHRRFCEGWKDSRRLSRQFQAWRASDLTKRKTNSYVSVVSLDFRF